MPLPRSTEARKASSELTLLTRKRPRLSWAGYRGVDGIDVLELGIAHAGDRKMHRTRRHDRLGVRRRHAHHRHRQGDTTDHIFFHFISCKALG